MQVDFWDSLEEMSPYYLIEHDDKWEKIFFNISDVQSITRPGVDKVKSKGWFKLFENPTHVLMPCQARVQIHVV